MKILHAPENIGGMAGVIAKEQAKLGHESISYSFSSNQYKYYSDITLKDPGSYSEKLKNSIKFALKYDVFHFYFGSSLMGMNLKDVKFLSHLGKKIFFHFCGCDIRDEKYTVMNYPISACSQCFPKLCSSNRKLAYEISSEYGVVNFVSTPDLMEFVERPILLPQPIDLSVIDKVKSEPITLYNSSSLVIAHAPTNRAIKGTKYVIDTIEALKKEGYDIELLLIENLSHEEALKKYRQADIAIDQLLVGSYGQLSAELMALGIPTICFIREDLKSKYPEEVPIINADFTNLKEVILSIYHNRKVLENYKRMGPLYANKYHHPALISKKCLECYGL